MSGYHVNGHMGPDAVPTGGIFAEEPADAGIFGEDISTPVPPLLTRFMRVVLWFAAQCGWDHCFEHGGRITLVNARLEAEEYQARRMAEMLEKDAAYKKFGGALADLDHTRTERELYSKAYSKEQLAELNAKYAVGTRWFWGTLEAEAFYTVVGPVYVVRTGAGPTYVSFGTKVQLVSESGVTCEAMTADLLPYVEPEVTAPQA